MWKMILLLSASASYIYSIELGMSMGIISLIHMYYPFSDENDIIIDCK